jgi:class 3 adenylate cyclase
MKNIKIPRYKVGRIYLLPLLMYFMLVLPLLFFMAFKGFPELSKRTGFREQISDTVQTIPNKIPLDADSSISGVISTEENNIDTAFFDAESLSFKYKYEPDPESRGGASGTLSNLFNILVLITPFVGFAVNIPFKRYFKRKRKGKVISPRLYRFCRKYILKTPLLNSGIVFIAFTVVHMIMIYTLIFPEQALDAVTQRMLTNFLFVSVVASMLTVLFIYFWQKHLVHIRYLEHIFTPAELQKRIFGRRTGKIRNRLYIASAMTTLFPLTIVILYLLLSLTPVSDLKNPTPNEMRVVLGSIVDLMGPVDDFSEEGFNDLYYIPAIDNTLMFFGILSGILVSFIYILFFVNWSTQGIVKPVNDLVRSMLKTGEGLTGHYTLVRTNDEVGIMSESYNVMSAQLSEYITHISRLNEAYFRFVPRQFLDFLDKKDIVDIQLGDQVQKEMTVMFSDIRGFTELSESMTPKENFDFINHYLGYMEPIIRNNNGFIDKFIGDAIMALFHDKADNALNAAIQMRKMLKQFNTDRIEQGLPPIDSGIGMHTGNLMLGVVGGEGRMDGTVISDAVNLAARLEGLTKIYQSSIILSEDTLIKLENPAAYHFRFLDIARVKGKKEAVYMFELLDGDPDDIKTLKIASMPLYSKAIESYKNKQFEEAEKLFSQVLALNPNDAAALFYINRCRNFRQKGIADDWSGIEVFDAK